MQLLLLCGATTTLGTLEGSNLLSKGSTALHIAAARGSQPCCSVLLDHESGRRGTPFCIGRLLIILLENPTFYQPLLEGAGLNPKSPCLLSPRFTEEMGYAVERDKSYLSLDKG